MFPILLLPFLDYPLYNPLLLYDPNLPCIFITDLQYLIPSVASSFDSLRTHQVSPGALHSEVPPSLSPLKVIAVVSGPTAYLMGRMT